MSIPLFLFFFFFNDTATTEIYTLSLHDALPICYQILVLCNRLHNLGGVQGHDNTSTNDQRSGGPFADPGGVDLIRDRKSTRLNSSHSQISYAVFCLKKKKYNSYPSNQSNTEVYI